MIFDIETPRLLLRAVQERDRTDLFELMQDEQGCLDDGGYHAFTEMDDRFGEIFDLFLQRDQYAIVLKSEDKAVGTIHLMEENRAVPTRELGVRVNAAYQHRGYAYEAISALIAACFDRTDTQMFLAGHFPHNIASQSLIQKLGFTLEGRQHKAVNHVVLGPTDLVYYYLEKPDSPQSAAHS